MAGWRSSPGSSGGAAGGRRTSCGSWPKLDEPGAKFAEVARRHEVSRGLLWQWRDAQRRGTLVADEPVFVPLRVVPELPPPEPQPPGAASAPSAPPAEPAVAPDGRIEIVLPDGTAVRVAESISTTALRRVLAALRG